MPLHDFIIIIIIEIIARNKRKITIPPPLLTRNNSHDFLNFGGEGAQLLSVAMLRNTGGEKLTSNSNTKVI